jgi:hypothetical protein
METAKVQKGSTKNCHNFSKNKAGKIRWLLAGIFLVALTLSQIGCTSEETMGLYRAGQLFSGAGDVSDAIRYFSR